jgi:drug/metabolite transporter (DMT)-like permease
MLAKLIASVLEALIGLLLRRLLGDRIVDMLKVTLAWVVFATLGGFCLYNLFWLVVSGTLSRLSWFT